MIKMTCVVGFDKRDLIFIGVDERIERRASMGDVLGSCHDGTQWRIACIGSLEPRDFESFDSGGAGLEPLDERRWPERGEWFAIVAES